MQYSSEATLKALRVDLGSGSEGGRKRTPRRRSPGLQETELKSISDNSCIHQETEKSVFWCHRVRTTVISAAQDLRQGRPHSEICAHMLGSPGCAEAGGSGLGLSGIFLRVRYLEAQGIVRC